MIDLKKGSWPVKRFFKSNTMNQMSPEQMHSHSFLPVFVVYAYTMHTCTHSRYACDFSVTPSFFIEIFG